MTQQQQAMIEALRALKQLTNRSYIMLWEDMTKTLVGNLRIAPDQLKDKIDTLVFDLAVEQADRQVEHG